MYLWPKPIALNIKPNEVDKSPVGRLTIFEKCYLTNKGRKGAFSSEAIHGVPQNKHSGKEYLKTNFIKEWPPIIS